MINLNENNHFKEIINLNKTAKALFMLNLKFKKF